MISDATFLRMKRRYRESGEIDAELFAFLRRPVFPRLELVDQRGE